MDFKKKIKIRLYVALSYLILGLLMIVLSFFTKNDMLSPLGIAFLVIAIARIRQYSRIIKNEEILLKRKIAETDELNIKIWTDARSLSLTIYISVLSVSIILLQLFKLQLYANILAYNLFAFVLIYWICYFMIKNKYK